MDGLVPPVIEQPHVVRDDVVRVLNAPTALVRIAQRRGSAQGGDRGGHDFGFVADRSTSRRSPLGPLTRLNLRAYPRMRIDEHEFVGQFHRTDALSGGLD
jgi:hypothetical protein